MTWELFKVMLQLTLALGLVLGLMWGAAKLLRSVGPAKNVGVVELLARQPVGRTAAVALVRVTDQVLVVGVTEENVSLLTETDLESVQAALAEQEAARAARRVGSGAVGSGSTGGSDGSGVVGKRSGSGGSDGSGLKGSILAPSTWKQAVEAIRDRTARRG